MSNPGAMETVDFVSVVVGNIHLCVGRDEVVSCIVRFTRLPEINGN